jgi:hypothetical protein
MPIVAAACACADATALASDDGTGAGDGLTFTACGSARGEPWAGDGSDVRFGSGLRGDGSIFLDGVIVAISDTVGKRQGRRKRA